MTQAEKLLWERLKLQRDQFAFRRQHIISDYIADFICIKKKLIVEIDGKYHMLPQQHISDEERTAHLERFGYKVLRFTNEQVYDHLEDVLSSIYDILNRI